MVLDEREALVRYAVAKAGIDPARATTSFADYDNAIMVSQREKPMAPAVQQMFDDYGRVLKDEFRMRVLEVGNPELLAHIQRTWDVLHREHAARGYRMEVHALRKEMQGK
jgi:hypothetical protein